MPIELGAGTSSAVATRRTGGFGVGRIGGMRIGQSGSVSYITIAAPVESDELTIYDSPWGVGGGYRGMRIFSRPVVRAITVVLPIDDSAMEVTFYEKSGGAVMGRIGTEAQKNIIKSIEWQEDRTGGSGDALITLSALPSFPVLPFSEVAIRFGRAQTPVYRGTLQYDELDGSTQDEYEFRVSGLREQLQNVRANTVVSGPADVGQTFSDLAVAFVSGNTSIRISSGAIDRVTGKLHQGSLDLGKDSISRIFEALATMASATGDAYNFWVDGSGLLNFGKEPVDLQGVLLVGYNLREFNPRRDVETVKNSIIVKRQKPAGSGETGWTVSSNSPYQNLPSQAKYGLRQETVQVPGYFLDNEADIIGNQIIADRAEPTDSASATIPIRNRDGVLTRGRYRFVTAKGVYASDIIDPDTAAGWSKFGSGDLLIGFSTSTLLSGSGALQLAYTSAQNDRAEYGLATPIRAAVQKIRMYIRASRGGQYLTLGIGESVWNQHTKPIVIQSSNAWNLFEWDVSDLDPTIGVIAVRVDEASANTVYVDRIQAVLSDNRHYDMRFTRAKYRWRANTGLECTAEFGPLTPNLENYIRQLVRLDADRETAGESR